ncbi:MerR family transcriptional regulator [Streptomyces tendae]
MAWRPRQLADLAGTTVGAVRRYHDAGLLEEPPRRANGHKQYGVAHLVRVLRIKRRADLGDQGAGPRGGHRLRRHAARPLTVPGGQRVRPAPRPRRRRRPPRARGQTAHQEPDRARDAPPSAHRYRRPERRRHPDGPRGRARPQARAVLRPAPRGAPAPLASRPGPDSAGPCHARQRSGHGPHAARVDRAATARCTLRA